MIEIRHLTTTKLPNEISRLLFEIKSTGYNDFKCKLMINLHWLFGGIYEISVGNYHLQKDTFHIDIPDKIVKKSSRVNWQLIGSGFFKGQYSRLKRTGKMSPLKLC